MPISRRPAAHVEGSTLAPTDRHGGARLGIASPFPLLSPWTCWLLGRASVAHPHWYGGCEERRNHTANRAERRTEDEAMLVEAPAGDGDAACASRHGRGGRRREELQLPAGRHRRGVPGHHGADEGRQTRDRETAGRPAARALRPRQPAREGCHDV